MASKPIHENERNPTIVRWEVVNGADPTDVYSFTDEIGVNRFLGDLLLVPKKAASWARYEVRPIFSDDPQAYA